MNIQKDDIQLPQIPSVSHANESNFLEIGFLIGLLVLVVTTFAIFYYALPTFANYIGKAQKNTESSFEVTV